MTLPPTSFTPGAEPVSFFAPDPAQLFQRRAARLAVLSPASDMAEWLDFVGLLARAQHDALATVGERVPLPVRGDGLLAGLTELPWWWAMSEGVLKQVAAATDGSVRGTVQALLAQDAAVRAAAARRIAAGELGEADLAAAPLLTAALELGATLVAATSRPEGLSGVQTDCPVCGSAPVAAVIGATPTGKVAAGAETALRYLHCGWCNSAWHHVRAQCVSCGGSGKVSYRAIEGDNPAWQAETCDECSTYTKLLRRADARDLDPVADDLASLTLDMVLGEAGYRRRGTNPYLLLATDRELQ